MAQLAFEGMPERLYAATPARLTTYDDCPRRYRHAYLDRPTPARRGATGHTSVGASVHTALARWWALPRASRTPEQGGRLLTEAWIAEGFRDPAQAAAARELARGQVERYLGQVDPDDVPVAVERTVTLRTEHASLWGRVDRVDDRAGAGLVVVDYKTGRWVPTAEDARDSTALGVYAAAVGAGFRRPCLRVELHHLPSGGVAAWDHTPGSLAEAVHRADALAARLADLDDRHAVASQEAADGLFPAQVASRCGWCEFRPVCGPGRSQPARSAWSAVVTSD
jgi:putative RecB family exonuclease